MLRLAKVCGHGVEILATGPSGEPTWIRRGGFDVRSSHGFGGVCFKDTGVGVKFVVEYLLMNDGVTLAEALANFGLGADRKNDLLRAARVEMLNNARSLANVPRYEKVFAEASVEIGSKVNPAIGARVLQTFLSHGFGIAPREMAFGDVVLTGSESLSVVLFAATRKTPYFFLPYERGKFLFENHPRAVKSTVLTRPQTISCLSTALQYTEEEETCLRFAHRIFRPAWDIETAKPYRKLKDIE